MRALKAKRTGVRGWAAALKVEQASVEHQLAGCIGGLPSRSGRAGHAGRPCAEEGKEGECGWAGQQARPVDGPRARRRPGVGLEGKKESFFFKSISLSILFLFLIQNNFKYDPIKYKYDLKYTF